MYGRDYMTIDRGMPNKMDLGKPFSFSSVLYRPPAHATFKQLYRFAVGFVEIQNRHSAVQSMGVGARIDGSYWKAGQWVNATTTFTDDTVDAQDSDVTDFPLETLTVNDGFIVFSLDRFNAICIDVGTAGVGSPVRVLEYSRAGGTWGSITGAPVFPATTNWAVGENLVLFEPPPDWAVSEAGHGTGVPLGFYGIRFRNSTAPATTAAVANSMSIAEALFVTKDVGAGVILTAAGGSAEKRFMTANSDALVAICEVAVNQTKFTVGVKTLG